jgi:outer membrane protein TolC
MNARIWSAGPVGWAAFLSTSLAWAQAVAPESPAPSDAVTPAMRVTLDDAVARALTKNPTYATALLEARRADAVVRETKAAWLPTVYSYESVTHLDGNRVESGNVILAQNELSANVTVTVPLVMTRQWLTTEESRMGADATRATTGDVRRLVAYATGQAYLAVYAQKLVIDVDERARDTARSHAAYAHQRYAGGVGNSIDEVRAAQEAATDDALVQKAYALFTSDREALGILVGADGPLDTADEPTLAEPPSLQDALGLATLRPDVVALDLRSQAARKTVDDDWSDYAPYLVGVAQPFYQNPATPTLPLSGYSLELLLTVPLYDGGLRDGQHGERSASRDEASVAYDAGLRQARSDVRAAFEAMRRADDALRSARDAAKLARQALDLANVAYRGGATTNIEVIDAERQARDAATYAEMAADGARQARLTMLTATDRFPERTRNPT